MGSCVLAAPLRCTGSPFSIFCVIKLLSRLPTRMLTYTEKAPAGESKHADRRARTAALA